MGSKGLMVVAALIGGLTVASAPARALTLQSATTDQRGNLQFADPDQSLGTDAQTNDGRSNAMSYWGPGRDTIPLDDRGLPYGVAPPRDLSHQYWGAPLLQAPGEPPQ